MKNEFPNRDVLMSILSTTASVVRVQGEIDIKDLNKGDRSVKKQHNAWSVLLY